MSLLALWYLVILFVYNDFISNFHDTAINLFCSWARVKPSGACRNSTISDCLKYLRASGHLLATVVKGRWIQHTFVDEYQAKVVSGRILLVDFTESGSQVEATQEQPDGDCLACKVISPGPQD